MTSQVDPKKLKSLLNKSQTELDPPEDEEGGGAPADAESASGEGADDEEEEGEEPEEQTVESLTASLKEAVPTINEIIDEFRTGSDAQPKAGVEQLEEEIDAETIHGFCGWTVDAGKKDFRKLGEALDVEDVDGFVGWCRAVRKMEEEEGEGGESGGEASTEEEPEGGEPEGEDEPEAE